MYALHLFLVCVCVCAYVFNSFQNTNKSSKTFFTMCTEWKCHASKGNKNVWHEVMLGNVFVFYHNEMQAFRKDKEENSIVFYSPFVVVVVVVGFQSVNNQFKWSYANIYKLD